MPPNDPPHPKQRPRAAVSAARNPRQMRGHWQSGDPIFGPPLTSLEAEAIALRLAELMKENRNPKEEEYNVGRK